MPQMTPCHVGMSVSSSVPRNPEHMINASKNVVERSVNILLCFYKMHLNEMLNVLLILKTKPYGARTLTPLVFVINMLSVAMYYQDRYSVINWFYIWFFSNYFSASSQMAASSKPQASSKEKPPYTYLFVI